MQRIFITVLFILSTAFQLLQAQDKPVPVVLGTASMITDMAQNIFGEHADVKGIVPIGGDPHLFTPTPSSVKEISECQLVLMNGLTLEGWLEKVIKNSGTKAEIVTVTEGINTIKSDTYTNSDDPHAWMDAENAIVYAENIMKAAQKLIPEQKEAFSANFEKYKAELVALDSYITKQIQSIPEKQRILITSHDAFQYYGKKYAIELKSILGTSTEADAQTSDRIALEKAIKETGVPAIFVESTINPKTMKTIAKDHGIVIGGKLYADSLGDEDSGANTYLKMMRQNTDMITDALTKEKVVVAEKENSKGMDTTTYAIIAVILGLLVALFALKSRNRK